MRLIAELIFAVTILSSVHASSMPHKSQKGQSAPKELLGTWEVVAGRIDVHAGPYKIPYTPNDVRYMAIELVIEPNRVSYDITNVCEKPRWRSMRSVVKQQIGYRRVPSASAPNGMNAPLRDMGFREFRLNDPLTVYQLHCADKSNFPTEASHLFFGSNKDRLYTGVNDIYLVYKRRLLGSQPNPSFACGGEASPVRRTICNSIALAARERSLADVWSNNSSVCRPAPSYCSAEEQATQRKAATEQYRSWFSEEIEPCRENITCILEKIREGASLIRSDQWHDGNRDLR